MDRKPPYKHPVTGHYREGKYIDNYTRGHGNRPHEQRAARVSVRGGSVYNVVFLFPDGSTESYNGGGTATGALKEALGKIQRAMIPKQATLTRVGGR